jgi:hypothetical protein
MHVFLKIFLAFCMHIDNHLTVNFHSFQQIFIKSLLYAKQCYKLRECGDTTGNRKDQKNKEASCYNGPYFLA